MPSNLGYFEKLSGLPRLARDAHASKCMRVWKWSGVKPATNILHSKKYLSPRHLVGCSAKSLIQGLRNSRRPSNHSDVHRHPPLHTKETASILKRNVYIGPTTSYHFYFHSSQRRPLAWKPAVKKTPPNPPFRMIIFVVALCLFDQDHWALRLWGWGSTTAIFGK